MTASQRQREKDTKRKTLAEKKAVDSPKGNCAKGLKTGWMRVSQRENTRVHGWKNANIYESG